jgi:hypothetical protein
VAHALLREVVLVVAVAPADVVHALPRRHAQAVPRGNEDREMLVVRWSGVERVALDQLSTNLEVLFQENSSGAARRWKQRKAAWN